MWEGRKAIPGATESGLMAAIGLRLPTLQH